MDENCTVYRTMDYLAKKWTIMILLELYKGEEWKRFSELKSRMKEITPKVLTERLKELIDQGLVENRIDASVMPAKSEYRLTEASRELMPCIREIKMWALKWKIHNPECASQQCFLCKLRCGRRQRFPAGSTDGTSNSHPDFPNSREDRT